MSDFDLEEILTSNARPSKYILKFLFPHELY